VVDPQIGGHGLVARCLVAALPLDQRRDAPPQRIGGGQEGGAVVEARPEGAAVAAAGPQAIQAVPVQLVRLTSAAGRAASAASTLG